MTSADTTPKPKRFYKTVTVVPVDAETASGAVDGTADGATPPRGPSFAVMLDERAVKTPARQPLVVPTRALGAVLAGEWDRQTDTIDLASMLANRLVNVALDQTPNAREAMIDQLCQYAQTDCVCYVSDSDAKLRTRQDAVWGPLRAWASDALGVHLVPVESILAVPQPAESLATVKALGAGMDDIRLTAVCHGAALSSSAVLALALAFGPERGGRSAREVFAASRLEVDHQAQAWGADEETIQRGEAVLSELLVVERVLRALEDGAATDD